MKIRVAFFAVVLAASFTAFVSAQGKNAKTPDVIFVEELQSLLNTGDLEKAISHFDRMPSSLAKNSDIKLLKASILVSANRLTEATPDTK